MFIYRELHFERREAMSPISVIYKNLYLELKDFEASGIPMLMGEHQVNSLQVVQAYMSRETGTYMRDYVMNSEGSLEILAFHKVLVNAKYPNIAP